MKATVRDIQRAIHLQTIQTFVEKLGHTLKPVPRIRNNHSVATCATCGLAAVIKCKSIPMSNGRINEQMKCDGPMMVKKCEKGNSNDTNNS